MCKERWTQSHMEWLKICGSEFTDSECAYALGRTLKSIKLKRRRIGIKKLMGRPKGKPNKIITKLNEIMNPINPQNR